MKIYEIKKEERPIERLIEQGKENLTNIELLSIIIGSGTKDKSCKDLANEILVKIESIEELKNISINTLNKIKGLGNKKSSKILATIELGKRIYNTNKNIKNTKYISAYQIYNDFKNIFIDEKQEYFYALYFDNKQHIIDKKLLFKGTVNRSVVHPREIFKYAYLNSASTIICIHNHPSNDVNPSEEDKEITNSLIKIGMINKIPLIDHIIIGNEIYFSFKENNMI